MPSVLNVQLNYRHNIMALHSYEHHDRQHRLSIRMMKFFPLVKLKWYDHQKMIKSY
ncbi:hypothetical protein BLA29_014599 [Euroglyphus maynei]|uniref:Uncharacterized protein n=1 Tax=Euroglyphus maynei TaxID=6958 RepID=A0A1Y3B4J7_EURMA|nr:hypothetical protein BLA29_014599 [Euroglyphus maynei]